MLNSYQRVKYICKTLFQITGSASVCMYIVLLLPANVFLTEYCLCQLHVVKLEDNIIHTY